MLRADTGVWRTVSFIPEAIGALAAIAAW